MSFWARPEEPWVWLEEEVTAHRTGKQGTTRPAVMAESNAAAEFNTEAKQGVKPHVLSERDKFIVKW